MGNYRRAHRHWVLTHFDVNDMTFRTCALIKNDGDLMTARGHKILLFSVLSFIYKSHAVFLFWLFHEACFFLTRGRPKIGNTVKRVHKIRNLQVHLQSCVHSAYSLHGHIFLNVCAKFFFSIHPSAAGTFYSKPQILTEWHEKSKGITTIITTHHLETINALTKFCSIQ